MRFRKQWIFVLGFVGAIANGSVPTDAEEINVPAGMDDHEVIGELDVVGLRAFAPTMLGLKGMVGIPAEFFYKTAASIPEVRDKLLKQKSPLEANAVELVVSEIATWRKINAKVKDAVLEKFWKTGPWHKKGNSGVRVASTIQLEKALNYYVPKYQPVEFAKAEFLPNSDGYDLNFMTRVAGTELLNIGAIKTAKQTFGKRQHILVLTDRSVARDYSTTFTLINFVHATAPTLRAHKFNQAMAQVRKHPQLASAASVKLATITLGRPLVTRPEDYGDTVPETLAKQFDVYVIRFAFSDRRFISETVDEIAFIVRFPTDVTALELVPLDFLKSAIVQEESGIPAVEGSVGPVSIGTGPIFQHRVTFERLRPTIIAQGLQEHNVSWQMRDEAAVPGSKKFIAVVGVPKGSSRLSVELSAVAKFDTYRGVQGGIGSTVEKKVEIELVN